MKVTSESSALAAASRASAQPVSPATLSDPLPLPPHLAPPWSLPATPPPLPPPAAPQPSLPPLHPLLFPLHASRAHRACHLCAFPGSSAPTFRRAGDPSVLHTRSLLGKAVPTCPPTQAGALGRDTERSLLPAQSTGDPWGHHQPKTLLPEHAPRPRDLLPRGPGEDSGCGSWEPWPSTPG